MTENAFIVVVEQWFDRLSRVLDQTGLDYEVNGGVLEINFDSGEKMIINRHLPNREIWVAAKSGGFHFALNDRGEWLDTRDGTQLEQQISGIIRTACGLSLDWDAR